MLCIRPRPGAVRPKRRLQGTRCSRRFRLPRSNKPQAGGAAERRPGAGGNAGGGTGRETAGRIVGGAGGGTAGGAGRKAASLHRGKSRRKCCFCPPFVVSLSVMTGPEAIFGIDNRTTFERLALEVFRRQAAACHPTARYLALIGVDPQQVRHSDEIPHLPIELFKSHEVYCGDREPRRSSRRAPQRA